MSVLPPPAARRPIHTRRVSFEGFLRDDGLWDIDCELSDVKSESVTRANGKVLPAGEPAHLMRVRLTLDDELTVRAVQAAMPGVPFGECRAAGDDPMQKLVGLTMGRGWRRKIDDAMGGTGGCTHLRELVFNAATAAFQMIPHYKKAGSREDSFPGPGSQPPFYMGKCLGWSFEGPVVQRLAPHFYRGPAVRKDG